MLNCVLDESQSKKLLRQNVLYDVRDCQHGLWSCQVGVGGKLGYFLPRSPASPRCHLSTSFSPVQYLAVIITENVTF